MMAKTVGVKESECAGTADKETVLTVPLVRPRGKSANLFPVSMSYEISRGQWLKNKRDLISKEVPWR